MNPEPPRQKLLGAAAGLLITVFAGAARAESGPTWLEWSAPPECPTAGDIERHAQELFGGPLPPDRRLAVATDLRWDGGRWEIAVDVALDGLRGERQVTVDSCSQAADFVAVAVVLAVDPNSSERLSSEANTNSAPARPDREPVEPQPQVEAPLQSVVEDELRRPRKRAQGGPRVAPHLSLLLDGAVGVLPDARLGGALWVGADVGRITISAVGEWYPAAEANVEHAETPIDFGLMAGRINVAYWFLGPRARVGPSLSLHAGVMESAQADSGYAVEEPWVALGVGPQGVVLLGGPVSLLVEGELNVPLVMPTFVLDDGTEVHRPQIGGRIALGGRILLGQ